jgi:hypothetical protein
MTSTPFIFEKLPSAHSNQRRAASSNPWLEMDVAERRKPIVLVTVLVATLVAGFILILFGLGR